MALLPLSPVPMPMAYYMYLGGNPPNHASLGGTFPHPMYTVHCSCKLFVVSFNCLFCVSRFLIRPFSMMSLFSFRIGFSYSILSPRVGSPCSYLWLSLAKSFLFMAFSGSKLFPPMAFLDSKSFSASK